MLYDHMCHLVLFSTKAYRPTEDRLSWLGVKSHVTAKQFYFCVTLLYWLPQTNCLCVYCYICCVQDIDVAWRWSLLVPMLLLAVQAVVLFFLPESPRWVLAQKTPASE